MNLLLFFFNFLFHFSSLHFCEMRIVEEQKNSLAQFNEYFFVLYSFWRALVVVSPSLIRSAFMLLILNRLENC